jgi:hypothetical protein
VHRPLAKALIGAGVALAAVLGVCAGNAAASHPITPPPPRQLVLGSDLQGTPENVLGMTGADTESYPYFLYAYSRSFGGAAQHPPQALGGIRQLLDPFLAGAASARGAYEFPLVPVNGVIASYTVKGFTESSNVPGPHGAGVIGLGVERPLADGRLEVISTSNPGDELPSHEGTYTFDIGPPATRSALAVTAGDVISLDTPGGAYAVWAAQPGAEIETTIGHGGPEQSPGVDWTGIAHPNVELLMSVTIRSSVSIAKLQAAEQTLRAALKKEHASQGASGSRGVAELEAVAAPLKRAASLIAKARSEGAVSAKTASSLDYYVDAALAAVKHHSSTSAISSTQTAFLDAITARVLAKKTAY